MPRNLIYEPYTILAGGATKSFDVADEIDTYVILANGGTVTLAADMIFNSTGTAALNDTFNILYMGGVTTGAFRVMFFGTVLSTAQALYKQHIIARYNGSAWDVFIASDDSDATTDLDGGDLVNGSVTNNKLFGEIALAKLLATGTQGQFMRTGVNGAFETANAANTGAVLGGDGTDVLQQVVGGDLTKSGATWTIANNAVTTAKIDDEAVTAAKLSVEAATMNIPVAVSFETGEQAIYPLPVDFAGTVVGIYAKSTKAIAATDNGTITFKNNAGTTMTDGTITFTASDPINTAYTSTPSANNTFVAGDILTITPTKTTAGGKVIVFVQILRS